MGNRARGLAPEAPLLRGVVGLWQTKRMALLYYVCISFLLMRNLAGKRLDTASVEAESFLVGKQSLLGTHFSRAFLRLFCYRYQCVIRCALTRCVLECLFLSQRELRNLIPWQNKDRLSDARMIRSR